MDILSWEIMPGIYCETLVAFIKIDVYFFLLFKQEKEADH